MARREGLSADAVFAAMEEFDRLGREAFLDKYGFGRAKTYVVLRDGKQYDSKAIFGVAYGRAHPEEGPLSSADFTGGEMSVVRKLERLGFEVKRLRNSGLLATDRESLLFFFTAANRAAREHLEVSMRQGIPLESLRPLEDVYPTLRAHSHDGRVFAWGARPGSAAERKMGAPVAWRHRPCLFRRPIRDVGPSLCARQVRRGRSRDLGRGRERRGLGVHDVLRPGPGD
jgi:hypothetical protein